MARELEARLKISAIDRASRVIDGVARRIDAIDRKARAVSQADSYMAQHAARMSDATHSAMMMAGGAAVIGATVAGRAAREAIIDYAALERQINRVGITAGASDEQISGAANTLAKISQDMATPLDETMAGFEALIAAGRSWEESLAFLPAVVQTAQAAGASTYDIAQTADALAGSMKIAGSEMQLAFDKLVTGGKLGKFELKDMARYLPEILPMMSSLGYSGQEGLEKSVALLQTMRLNSGDASGAAVKLLNVLGKFNSAETIGRFQEEFGIDLLAELEKETKAGADLLDSFVKITRQATGGDMDEMKKIFTDQEFTLGTIALMQHEDAQKRYLTGMSDVAGTAAADALRVINDTQGSLDRLSNSWTRASQNLGKALVSAGAADGLENIGDQLERISGYLDDLSEKGIVEATTKAFEDSAASVSQRFPAGKAFADALERAAGRPATSAEIDAFTGFAGGIVDPGKFPGMSPDQIAAAATEAGRKRGLAEAYQSYGAGRAGAERAAARSAQIMETGQFREHSVPTSVETTAGLAPMRGSFAPAQADGFRRAPGGLSRPISGPGASVAPETLAWWGDMANRAPSSSGVPTPSTLSGGGARAADDLVAPFVAASEAGAARIDTAFQGIDVAGAVRPSMDEAAAAVDAAADRIIAARARVDAAWAKPLPTPSAPGGVRVDPGLPQVDAMGNFTGG